MSHATAEPSPPHPQREAFILRLWRAPDGGPWRCHLIHVETGQRLPCQEVAEVSQRIEAWLTLTEERAGLR